MTLKAKLSDSIKPQNEQKILKMNYKNYCETNQKRLSKQCITLGIQSLPMIILLSRHKTFDCCYCVTGKIFVIYGEKMMMLGKERFHDWSLAAKAWCISRYSFLKTLESMFYSSYVAAKLGIWRKKGKQRLVNLLVKMGLY